MRRAHKKALLTGEPARSACEAAPSAPTERTIHGSPYRGAGSRRLTERLYQICSDLSVSASPSHLPWKGRLGICAPQGFPYEGKLSPQATDEVDSVAEMQLPPPHPSRLRRAASPERGGFFAHPIYKNSTKIPSDPCNRRKPVVCLLYNSQKRQKRVHAFLLYI